METHAAEKVFRKAVLMVLAIHLLDIVVAIFPCLQVPHDQDQDAAAAAAAVDTSAGRRNFVCKSRLGNLA